jgi:hypothetical protein
MGGLQGLLLGREQASHFEVQMRGSGMAVPSSDRLQTPEFVEAAK